MNKFRAIFHFIGFLIFTFAIFYDVQVIGWKVFDKFHMKPHDIPLKGRLMFLTIWNLVSCDVMSRTSPKYLLEFQRKLNFSDFLTFAFSMFENLIKNLDTLNINKAFEQQ